MRTVNPVRIPLKAARRWGGLNKDVKLTAKAITAEILKSALRLPVCETLRNMLVGIRSQRATGFRVPGFRHPECFRF